MCGIFGVVGNSLPDAISEHLHVAIKTLHHRGPDASDIWIDRDAGVYPMVGPGMCYEEMITGDHIPSREVSKDKEEVNSSEMF